MSTFCKGSKMLLGSAYATRKNWLVKAVISKWTKTKNTFNQFGWLKQGKKLVSTVNVDLRYFFTYINHHTEIEQTYEIQHILPNLVYSNSGSFLQNRSGPLLPHYFEVAEGTARLSTNSMTSIPHIKKRPSKSLYLDTRNKNL